MIPATKTKNPIHKLRPLFPLLGTLAVGFAIWFFPKPEGLSTDAWHVLAIFVATIVGIIAKPLPLGAVAIISLAIATITNTLTAKQAFSSYSDPAIWLIVIAFFISLGFIKTRLGTRIAYYFVLLFGKTTLGLAYSLSLTELVLAPAIPSLTARSGGIILPIANSLSQTLKSKPNDPSARNLGTYLILVCFQVSIVTSAMFVTAMAANPVVVALAGQLGITLTWGTWALAAIVPGLLCLILIPYILYKLSPPKIKHLPDARNLALSQLKEMGKISLHECIMFGVFIFLIVFWILGDSLRIHALTTAIAGISVLLLTRVLTWNDLLEEKGAWATFVWFGALLTLASHLNKFGAIGFFSDIMAHSVKGLDWPLAFLILGLVYFYSHYFFASSLAHVGAMYAAFVSVSILLGTPPFLAALVLGFFSNLYGGLTHYGMGSAPVLFGANYVSTKEWWIMGFIISIINIVIWVLVGGAWWHFLGYWSLSS